MRVVFAGTPEFALPALEALLEHHDVTGVLTRPDRPRGRGRVLAASPVKVLAESRQIPVFQPLTLREGAALERLAGWNPEALVVVAYGLLLPPEVLQLPHYGCLNIHASLLPRWRGAAPIQRAILAGDRTTGISIMRMDAGLDSGPVLLTEEIPIGPGDTSGSLHSSLARLGASSLIRALAGLVGGTLEAHPQPATGATYAARISKAEGRIDWSRSAAEIDRQVRAFNPWPVAETTLAGERLRIHAARALPEAESASKMPRSAGKDSDPGSIVGIRDGNMRVQCGRGELEVFLLQRPGGRVIPAREFAHNRNLQGQRLA